MNNRDYAEPRIDIYDRLAALAKAQSRVAKLTGDDSMLMFHAGYLSALEDVAQSLGFALPIRAEQLPVVIKNIR